MLISKCTFCGNDLTALPYAGIEIDRCGRCKALWFDAGELEKYAATRHPTARSPLEIQPDGDGLRLGCPRCNGETLTQVRVLDVTAWHCSECRGVSLEQDSVVGLARHGSARGRELEPWVEIALDAPQLGEAGSIVLDAVLDILGFFRP